MIWWGFYWHIRSHCCGLNELGYRDQFGGGADAVLAACRLRTINIMAVCPMRLIESSMLTDDLLKREGHGSRERRED